MSYEERYDRHVRNNGIRFSAISVSLLMQADKEIAELKETISGLIEKSNELTGRGE